MFRRVSESLAAKVFLLVLVALTASCIGLYSIVAAVFPGSFSAVSAASAQKSVEELIEEIERANQDELYRVTDEWAEQNAAAVTVLLDGTTRILGSEPDSGADVAYTITSTVELADGRQATLGVTDATGAMGMIETAFDRLLIPALGLIVAASLLASWACSRLVARPVVELSDISARLARLDMTWRADERRSDELGALGRSLNSMADRLRETIAGLERANAELAREADEARKRERKRRDFLAAASHELKTPLAVARVQAEGMMLGIGSFSDHAAHLPQVVAAVDRMDALVHEMLESARADVEEGGPVDLDLAAELVRARARVLPIAEGRSVELALSIGSPFPACACTRQLSVALDNILANAATHAPIGSHAEARFEGETLVVENPCGPIRPEDVERLFEPFYRLDPSRSAASGGTGLGLYLVKSALDTLGVPCHINVGDGTFRFTADFRSIAIELPQSQTEP